ncbi:MAG: hypothetical protein ACC682_01800 [Gemmatimonadota bacterium]
MKANVEGTMRMKALGRTRAWLTPWAALALLLIAAPPAGAHPEATLESDRTSVDAGGAIKLHGTEFGGDGTYTLRLLGALNEYDLGEAKSDGEGEFRLDITIPGDVRPGMYQVVALAADGDVSARLDLTVAAAMAMDMDAEAQADMGGAEMGEMAERQATVEEINIERNLGGIGWAAIGLIIGAAGGLGIGLQRRQPAA